MKIVLDNRWINKNIDGITRFSLSITRELLRLDTENFYYLLFKSPQLKDFSIEWMKISSNLNFESIILPISFSSVKNFYKVKFILRKLRPDIFFSPNYSIFCLFYPGKQFVVVHDIIPLKFPELFKNSSLKFKLFFLNKYFIKWVLKKVDLIFTVSNNTKNDIVNLLNIDKNKIRKIDEGVDINLDLIPDFYTVKNKYNIPEKYFLYVGRHDPYKNLNNLIKAYNLLPPEIKNQYKLVMAGEKDDRYTPQLVELTKELGIQDKVLFIGSVDSDDLVSIYKHAVFLIHPSLYEGFGLPIIEAMGYGVPIIASNTSSIPEIANDSVIFINPTEPQEISKAICNLLSNRQRQHKMIESGLKKVQYFNWSNTAYQILQEFKVY